MVICVNAFASLKDMPRFIHARGLLKKSRCQGERCCQQFDRAGLRIGAGLLAARWFGSLLIVRGISTLVATADRVAAGDLNVRTGLGQGEGEIQQLARAFDKMVEALQQWEAEHQRAEAELEKIRKYLENVFNESADGIGIVDERGKFTRWNKRQTIWVYAGRD
jgi:methyl-accepting chemotaxis protein